MLRSVVVVVVFSLSLRADEASREILGPGERYMNELTVLWTSYTVRNSVRFEFFALLCRFSRGKQ